MEDLITEETMVVTISHNGSSSAFHRRLIGLSGAAVKALLGAKAEDEIRLLTCSLPARTIIYCSSQRRVSLLAEGLRHSADEPRESRSRGGELAESCTR